MTDQSTNIETPDPAARRQYMDELVLDAEEFVQATAADLPGGYLQTLIETGSLDEAFEDDGGVRPHAIALVYLLDELAVLAANGTINHEVAARAWLQIRPQVAEAFNGLAARQYDVQQYKATLTPPEDGAEPVRLVFMERAMVRFYELVTGRQLVP